jgi:hypothetical protein
VILSCWAAGTATSVMTFGKMTSVVAGVVHADTLFVNEGGIGGLRNVNNKHKTPHQPRPSIGRRHLYGPGNGQVRKHVRLLEEQSQRSQTGFLSDPNHKVPYHNHPYDPESPTYVGKEKQQEQQHQRRQLQGNSEYTTDNPTTTSTTADLFKPLRIKFATDTLDSLRSDETAAKIDFIKTQVLPT